MPLLHIPNQGGKLAVEVLGGDNTGPLIVCSQGLGDLRNTYAPLADQLVPLGYRVALVDLRGHGDSSASGFSSFGDEEIASDFIAVVEHFSGGSKGTGAASPAVLVGNSMSGSGAVVAAGLRPDLIAGVVLLAAFLRPPSGSDNALMRAFLYVLFLPLWGPYMWKSYAAGLWPGLNSKANPHGAADRAALSTHQLTRSSSRWSAFRKSVIIDHGVVAKYMAKACHVPALVVVGAQDPDWKDPEAEAKWVSKQFDNATTVLVDGCGHAPQLERPAVVGPAVVQFVEKLRVGESFRV